MSEAESIQRPLDAAEVEAFCARRGIPELLIILCTLVVYACSLSCGFVYDDRVLEDSPHVHLPANHLWQLFTTDFAAAHASNFYRPLVEVWQWALTRWLGDAPTLWHLHSVLLHALCSVLVFWLAARLLRSRLLALMAALLFAAHPAHVEAVTWVSDIGDLLLTLFALASVLLFLRWQQSGGIRWLVLSLTATAASLLCKEVAVMLPPLVLAVALLAPAQCPAAGRRRSAWAALPFFVLAGLYLAIRTSILRGFAHPFTSATTADMLRTLPSAGLFYLEHFLFPGTMSVFYNFGFVGSCLSLPFIAPLVILLAVFAAVALWARRSANGKLILLLALWPVLLLAPAMYLKLYTPFELVHDRFLYAPSVGLCLLVVLLVAELVRRLPRGAEAAPALRASAVCMILVLLASVNTLVGQTFWRDDVSLFSHALQYAPNCVPALNNLGAALLSQHDYARGIPVVEHALAISPNNPDALFNRGRAAWETRDDRTAEHYFTLAAQAEPKCRQWLHLASVKLRLGKLDDAQHAATEAVRLGPNEQGVHLALGAVLLSRGDRPAAIREFQRELQLYPASRGAQMGLQQAIATQ